MSSLRNHLKKNMMQRVMCIWEREHREIWISNMKTILVLRIMPKKIMLLIRVTYMVQLEV